MDATGTASAAGDWRLSGSPFRRRVHIYRTAGLVASRYLVLNLPLIGTREPAARARRLARAHELGARDVRRTAVKLRGGFLKLGQFVSARPDLLPEAWVTELSLLQDRVPPAPFEAIKRVIEADLGRIEDHFISFDEVATASASLAQVHRATSKDGRDVAVKVQYPGVAEVVPRELADMERILGWVTKIVHNGDLKTISGVLQRSLTEELDYAIEANNLEVFRQNFAGQSDIVVPAVHRDLSRGRVLVMEWVEGENLQRALEGADRDTTEQAAKVLVMAYLKQILMDGFLHADPHPGNFLLSPGPDGPRIAFVDFGACERISDRTRLAMRRLYKAGLEEDQQSAIEAFVDLGFETRSGNLASLANWMMLFRFEDTEEDREAAWQRLMKAQRDDPVMRLPSELILVGRVLIVQTGLVSRIKPSWKMADLVAASLAIPEAP